ncbi:MAG: 30S ribosomal protein S16 [Desulfosporosinus sp.]|jgi:small subunit ribosomal protein S16
MATKIRLCRIGAKKNPCYRMVIADTKAPPDGRFIEQIGYYDPTKNPAVLNIDEEKAIKWLSTGAQPSNTAKSLLSHAGVLRKFHESKNKV